MNAERWRGGRRGSPRRRRSGRGAPARRRSRWSAAGGGGGRRARARGAGRRRGPRPGRGATRRASGRCGSGAPVELAEGDRLAQALDAGRRERPAPDLDDEPVERGSGGGELAASSKAERHAALDREAVLVALAGERERALGSGCGEQAVGRVAGHVRVAFADGDPGAERAEPGDDRRVGVGRDEDVELAAPPGRRPRRPGRRCRSSRSPAGRWAIGLAPSGGRGRRPRERSFPRARAACRTGGGPCANRRRCRSRP